MDLIELIQERVDPDELIEVLGLSTSDLVKMLGIRMQIQDQPELFEYLEPNEQPENPFEESL